VIDLHSHILPGVDDGSTSLEMSLDMARAAVASGVTVMACTPHIMQGVFPNTGPDIRAWTAELQRELDDAGIALRLVTGADNHIIPKMADALQEGRLLTLADTRYVLVELPHHVAPVRLDDFFFSLMMAGFVPVFTHPERVTWIDRHYEAVVKLAAAGVWIQITAASLMGRFGRRAQYWGERMLNDGIVHILASDAHNMTSRPPALAEGADAAARLVGAAETVHLIQTRPAGILDNTAPSLIPPPLAGMSTRVKDAASEEEREGSQDDAVRPEGDVLLGAARIDHPVRRRMRDFFWPARTGR
jgi:protein-tyrosine phosphatase